MRKLKFVYHVEDEEKNLIGEKRQVIIELTDEQIHNARFLPEVSNYPHTLAGLTAWADDSKTYRDIGDQFKAAEHIGWRGARRQIIEWAKAQQNKSEPV